MILPTFFAILARGEGRHSSILVPWIQTVTIGGLVGGICGGVNSIIFFTSMINCKKLNLLYNYNILLSFSLKGITMKFEKLLSFFSTSKNLEMTSLFYWWLIVAFFFLIMEIGHPGLFFFLSFCFGGLCAAAVSCATESLIIQFLSFFGGTIVALYILRYWGISLVEKNRPHQQTNFYALKGKRAVVTHDIAGEKPGLVTIGGQVWAARVVHHDDSVRIGDVVEVVDVRGAHVVVKKI
jgi:membrane protein implicated in regulation of membrane protease activity